MCDTCESLNHHYFPVYYITDWYNHGIATCAGELTSVRADKTYNAPSEQCSLSIPFVMKLVIMFIAFFFIISYSWREEELIGSCSNGLPRG